MRLLAQNRSAFDDKIDQDHNLETSIVCRYRNVLEFFDQPELDQTFKKYLHESSIQEGCRIVRLFSYKGVAIHILDETSCMATGTLKSIDGCLTAALCRIEETPQITFESGGNTGSALTRYGRQAGLETFFFCPLDNMDLLDSRLFDHQKTHLIGVEDRQQVKEFTELFAKTTGFRHVPEKSWRYAASMFRGLFILEHLLMVRQYDWISQTVSAGFGPIGIYNVLQTFQPEFRLPRFLGIQQESNCPMYNTLKPGSVKPPHRLDQQGKELLSRVMYDNTPQTYKTYEDMQQLLLQTQGDLLTVNEKEFDTYLVQSQEYGSILELLLAQDIAISMKAGQVYEKTGLIALIGALKAIDAGLISTGNSILCCLTSGVSTADDQAFPELTVRSTDDVVRYADTVLGG